MFTGPPNVSGGSDNDEEGPRSTAETEASMKGASRSSIGEEGGSEDSGVVDSVRGSDGLFYGVFGGMVVGVQEMDDHNEEIMADGREDVGGHNEEVMAEGRGM